MKLAKPWAEITQNIGSEPIKYRSFVAVSNMNNIKNIGTSAKNKPSSFL
jgi:hypothetical protein